MMNVSSISLMMDQSLLTYLHHVPDNSHYNSSFFSLFHYVPPIFVNKISEPEILQIQRMGLRSSIKH